MKKFRVQVKETYVCYVDVEAKDESEAYDIADKLVEDCEVVPSRDWDHKDQNISIIQQIEE